MKFFADIKYYLDTQPKAKRYTPAMIISIFSICQCYSRLVKMGVHVINEIINDHGWPGTSLVGLDGCRAAWMIAQHAISQPTFQMKCLDLIKKASEHGEVPARQVAFLMDRILFNKQKPQMYGSIGSWDSEGKISYGQIMDEDKVNQRRAIAGLGSIEDELAEHQKEVTTEGGKSPQDFDVHQKKLREWAKKAGWI